METSYGKTDVTENITIHTPLVDGNNNRKYCIKQECIPVGCVPSAAVTV